MFKFSIAFLVLFITLTALQTRAEINDFRVFEMKKTLPLNEKERVYYDYYVSMGEDQGVEPGNIITVYRRVPVVDNYRSINHDDMQVAVGQLKIIYTQKTMSIGRLIKHKRPANMPVLDYEKVMVGDRVELVSSKVAAE